MNSFLGVERKRFQEDYSKPYIWPFSLDRIEIQRFVDQFFENNVLSDTLFSWMIRREHMLDGFLLIKLSSAKRVFWRDSSIIERLYKRLMTKVFYFKFEPK